MTGLTLGGAGWRAVMEALDRLDRIEANGDTYIAGEARQAIVALRPAVAPLVYDREPKEPAPPLTTLGLSGPGAVGHLRVPGVQPGMMNVPSQ